MELVQKWFGPTYRTAFSPVHKVVLQCEKVSQNLPKEEKGDWFVSDRDSGRVSDRVMHPSF